MRACDNGVGVAGVKAEVQAVALRRGELGRAACSVLADEELMQLVYRGQAAAFEVIYDRHADAAFSLAYRMCGQRALAEDVVQEAFLSLWRSGARYDRGRGSVRTWVLGIVHNRAIDALRRRTVRERGRVDDEGIEERLVAPERTDVEVARRDEAREIRDALEQLPDEQSRVIELAYFGGLTHVRDRVDARNAGRNRQGAHAPGAGEDAHGVGRSHGGGAVSIDEPHIEEPDGCGASAAPYVLGALTDEEHEAFGVHLESCSVCREEVAALQVVASALPAAAPQLSAPPELKRRLMASVREDAHRRGVAGAREAPPRALRSRASTPLPAPLAAEPRRGRAGCCRGRAGGRGAQLRLRRRGRLSDPCDPRAGAAVARQRVLAASAPGTRS